MADYTLLVELLTKYDGSGLTMFNKEFEAAQKNVRLLQSSLRQAKAFTTFKQKVQDTGKFLLSTDGTITNLNKGFINQESALNEVGTYYEQLGATVKNTMMQQSALQKNDIAEQKQIVSRLKEKASATAKVNSGAKTQFRTYLSLMFTARHLSQVLGGIGGELNNLYASTMLEATGMSLMASYMGSTAGLMEEQFIDAITDTILAFDDLAPGVAGATIKFVQFGAGLLGTASEAAIVIDALGGKKGILNKLLGIGDFFTTNKIGRALMGAGGLALAIHGGMTLTGPNGELNWGAMGEATTGWGFMSAALGMGFLPGAALGLLINMSLAFLDPNNNTISWAALAGAVSGAALLAAMLGLSAPWIAGAAAITAIVLLTVKLSSATSEKLRALIMDQEIHKTMNFDPNIPEVPVLSVDEIKASAINTTLSQGATLNVPTGWWSSLNITDNMTELANGGVVTSPTIALVGEAGPEAVVPLSKMGDMGGSGDIYITVNASVSNDYDVKQLAQQIGVEMYGIRRSI